MMATAGQPLGDPYQTLKVTGEWNSKTTEDYIAMCRERIVSSEEMQQDLACIAGQWRRAAVQEIGRERYDELSEKLGCDLAYAYVDYRMEQLMIDRLVRERMPKSSAEYIIRKAAESSLLGLPQVLGRSPLAEEIEARGEAAYRPSKAEKGAAWALGATADTVMLGGAGSWATFAKFIGAGRRRLHRRRVSRKGQAGRPHSGSVHQQGRVRHRRQCLRHFPEGSRRHPSQRKRRPCRSE